MKQNKRRRKRVEQAIVKLPPPPKMRDTQFMRVLKGWQMVSLVYEQNGTHTVPYIISPTQKVYRYAAAWEKPTLVIDADILPPEHHIRLTLVTDAHTRKLAKKVLRHRHRLQKKKHALHRD